MSRNYALKIAVLLGISGFGVLCGVGEPAEAQKLPSEVIYAQYPYPPYPPYPYYPPTGGSPEAIADCVKKLLYERKAVCTRDGYCARLSSPEENANNNFGGWQWQTVRTSVSESAAAQACQGAR